ncbi:Protein of unknown function [Propionibacterium freudenreichii]|nr:Protein of unknown function [Propionibacterium freudenreichii]CEG91149.1 Protein of unknown function [Propionibacterium freudenreichii]CEG92909.1 Protein of unknown function [Propionibacterium freudenreichii]CEH00776.1 Protein of unknown function [Propionibacterium freudenreichii]CEI27802.1 Protein of unknown function [Propionibacterium freudenreichii]
MSRVGAVRVGHAVTELVAEGPVPRCGRAS